MGIVYEAEQISLGRRVALKVLSLAATLDGKHLQRFKHEAQAAGQLHHTHIVPVYAVGCERGVHYYAMQLINGQSLAALIRELRQQVGLQVDGDGPSPVPSGVAAWLLSGELLPAKPAASHGSTAPLPLASPAPTTPAAETLAQAGLSTERSILSKEYFRNVAQLGVQAAEALEHAHEEGIVHRDVKPANLLVDAKLWTQRASCGSPISAWHSAKAVAT
jgi:serine/threonine protein kinase